MLALSLIRTATAWLERRAELTQQRRDDAYLAASTDLADLELRQREIARPLPWIPAYG